ncbi:MULTISPECIES: DUF3422 family protein [Thalassospira]|jgi:uncharacterized membrane-anchored protein|uniref:Membrane protein n=1 Tax=Thalassospira profundimaris TaxID=502049 RepID=A0A367V578_9PROT|nr:MULTISPECIES: DUF3422 domain-containing protein [Thalassospira]MBR9902275.1 DUF3422 domain-containing protein [Rhodospirillales bacterium]KZB73355.1 hypothetical protein AUQ43_17990 [Thalassospira sp. MCCC 1A01148]MBO6809333.1 DUF3422 domain-containing protein [Thalassospira sp.]MBO6841932.1 DUF3422 domain-containing protein [Thalassospira sp.]MBS8275517.1 DUF3422 domain-containing protein [Thalassospira tepidiphila]|tara:strand:+ start:9415 stop:10683 length:1269 start_codon:yes stop_codon:yes gene_type:complete
MFVEHPQRVALHNEIHARPFGGVSSPTRCSCIAFHAGEELDDNVREHFIAFCERFSLTPPAPDQKYFEATCDGFSVIWERHAEFTVYVFKRMEPFDNPFDDPVINLVPQDWLSETPGQLMVGLHIVVEKTDRTEDEISRLFDHNGLTGSRVLGGTAQVWTDFRLHGDGFGRMLVKDQGMEQLQAGRLVQRLKEIEVYRMMALLAFPMAHCATPKVSEIDTRLSEITAEMASKTQADDEETLSKLTDLAAQTEEMAASLNYRFSAARAYYRIVQARLIELREERIEGVQTITEFMERRLAPAMRTCQNIGDRLEVLSKRVARANNLLRTRVDILLEAQNRDLLASMDRRVKLQLRLQQTVEGLSVAAITYYAVGLLGYLFKAIKDTGAPINDRVATGIAVPLVLGAIWFSMHRIRKALHRADD